MTLDNSHLTFFGGGAGDRMHGDKVTKKVTKEREGGELKGIT